MEHASQCSPVDVKPSDLDREGRLQAALINIIINGALIQVYHVVHTTSAPLIVMLIVRPTVYLPDQGRLASGEWHNATCSEEYINFIGWALVEYKMWCDIYLNAQIHGWSDSMQLMQQWMNYALTNNDKQK